MVINIIKIIIATCCKSNSVSMHAVGASLNRRRVSHKILHFFNHVLWRGYTNSFEVVVNAIRGSFFTIPLNSCVQCFFLVGISGFSLFLNLLRQLKSIIYVIADCTADVATWSGTVVFYCFVTVSHKSIAELSLLVSSTKSAVPTKPLLFCNCVKDHCEHLSPPPLSGFLNHHLTFSVQQSCNSLWPW